MGKYDDIAASARDGASDEADRLFDFETLLMREVRAVANLFSAEGEEVASALAASGVPLQKLESAKVITPRGWLFRFPVLHENLSTQLFVTKQGRWMDPGSTLPFEGLRYRTPARNGFTIVDLAASRHAPVLELADGAIVPTNLTNVYVRDGEIVVDVLRGKLATLESAMADAVVSRASRT